PRPFLPSLRRALAFEVLTALLDDGEPLAEGLEDAAVEEGVAHLFQELGLLQEVGADHVGRDVLAGHRLELGVEVGLGDLDLLGLDELLLDEEPADLPLGLFAAALAVGGGIEAGREFAALPLAELLD